MEKEKLEKFLENSFIPHNTIYKKINNIEFDNYEKVIYLNRINKLKVSNEEKKYILKYLKNKGISVRGYGNCVNFESDDYENLSTYINRIKQPTLSKEELAEKLKLYKKTKDIDLRNEIVLGNLGLVYYILYSKFRKTKTDYQQDLKQIGFIALINAVERYDETRGTFANFAINYIEGYMNTELYRLQGIKTSSYPFITITKKVEKEYGEKIKDNPYLAKIVADLIISKGTTKDKTYLLNKIMITNAESLEELNESENIYKLGYELEDLDINEIYEKEMKTKLHKEIDNLKEYKQKLLELYFGLNNENPHSTREIAKLKGVSYQSINQQINRIIKNLSNNEEVKSLKRYLHKEI